MFELWILTVFVLSAGPAFGAESDESAEWVPNPVDYVDPLIGTKGIGNHRQAANVVPGAVVPHGMFDFGPEHAYTEDLLAESERLRSLVIEKKGRVPVSPGGYNYAAGRIKGFSFTRLSGTGCLGASGDIPVLPFTGPVVDSPENDMLDAHYSAGFDHDHETATPGYYRVRLDNGIDVELSATTRTGIARFTYPDSAEAKLLFRTSYSQVGSGAAHARVDRAGREITGSVTSGNFCGYLGEFNRRDYYTLHFVARLDVPVSGSGAWEDDRVTPGAVEARGGMGYGDEGVPGLGEGSGVWVDLDLSGKRTVAMRVGISYVSLENARANLEAEQDPGEGFADIRERAAKLWNDALSGVKVVSGDPRMLATFYTALYHARFHPNVFSDANGEYWGFDQKPHTVSPGQGAQYANFSGWDVYRSQLQLVTLLDRDRGSDIAQSLLNQAAQYGGVWDRWTHNSGPTGVMCGDPATIAIANFVAFAATDFDVASAYASLATAAREATPYDLGDEGCPVFCRGQRPSLDQWLTLHYISDQSNSWEGASETLEQSSADFALSCLARRLGHEENAEEFLRRSGYWKNLYNPGAARDLGYIQGRNGDGSWKEDFDPDDEGLFVEGSPAQYLWMIPFDGGGLMRLLGGEAAMVERLDRHFHRPDGGWVLSRGGGAYADVSNQPSIASPWMYLFAGRADKTEETVREALAELWNDSHSGIPGQDDLGEMSSWYVFSALGLYPLYPGRADLVLSSPVFPRARIGNLEIRAPGASDDHRYVASLTVNGEPSSRSWIDETYLKEPVVLEFELSATPDSSWGSAPDDRPPSRSR